MPPEREVAQLLEQVAANLPEGGEHRPGQIEMVQLVSGAIHSGRHLVVQAGTGTGKSLAYLLAAVQSGRRVVVATATKALQDQLADKDLPFLAAQPGPRSGFTFAVLKGRSNYLCRQRASEIDWRPGQRQMFDAANPDDVSEDSEARPDVGRFGSQVRRILDWSERTLTGDRSDLDFEPHPRAWAALSIGARECPGAFRCPSGPLCFAERARSVAAASDIVIVNTHLYATHVASGGAVLPDHDVVVFDEAHSVEEVMTAGLGIELAPGRLRALAGSARGLLDRSDRDAADAVTDASDLLERLLRARIAKRVLMWVDAELASALSLARTRVTSLASALRRSSEGDDEDGRRARALLSSGHLLEDMAQLENADEDQVAWVESIGPSGQLPVLRLAPIEIGAVLASRLWPEVTGVLTSATIPPMMDGTLGLPRAETDYADVGSPFPFDRCALLYCPLDLPDRRSAGADTAVQEELERLIVAAGGRTLALFTSWRAMQAAVEALRPVLGFTVLAQNDLPKPKLLSAFRSEESACLFATMSFWQGVDVPGATLSLVAIDRIPFPRPDDPLLQARRERAGDAAFAHVDLPRAAILLAQGAGRLIRSSSDQGVVAVLDRRLATASYGRILRGALPPMRFTSDREEVVGFLSSMRTNPVRPRAAPSRRL